MKLVTIFGARPQFIKAAPVSRALRAAGLREIIIHTGQHYDDNMSALFFDELELPKPDYHLGVGPGTHGRQTGRMLEKIEAVLLKEKPDRVLVYGDTNSTLAGALAAAKLHIPLAHVEAGLRSFNRAMPEEVNRVLVDHLSDMLMCPSQSAVDNLIREGITLNLHLIGDVMYDAIQYYRSRAGARSKILGALGLVPGKYILATVHRAENSDTPDRLEGIVSALNELARDEPVVFPIHPRTRRQLENAGLLNPPITSSNFKPIEPIGYLDMIRLEDCARMILTDSGGVQKEAYWLGVPCITLRDETEWVETVRSGWNVVAGAGKERILDVARSFLPPAHRPHLYGDGQAATKLVARLLEAEEAKRIG
jgi:UDP-GlcNAc3NAcA epimerase